MCPCSCCDCWGDNHHRLCISKIYWQQGRCSSIPVHVRPGWSGSCGIHLPDAYVRHPSRFSGELPYICCHPSVKPCTLVVTEHGVAKMTTEALRGSSLRDCVPSRLVTSRTSVNQLLILRLIVHPTIWSLLIAVFSHTVRHIGDHSHSRIVCGACIADAMVL